VLDEAMALQAGDAGRVGLALLEEWEPVGHARIPPFEDPVISPAVKDMGVVTIPAYYPCLELVRVP
jgi:hypothetical protein